MQRYAACVRPHQKMPRTRMYLRRVLSLARSRERRAHAAAELRATGVTDFSFVDALDGAAPLPEAEVGRGRRS